jgi:hypothetical protein
MKEKQCLKIPLGSGTESGIKQKEGLYNPTCIRTHSGIYIDVFNPKPDQILIEDIAHALSNQPRFGGHMHTFYSVAQHSTVVASYVPARHKLAALMHDASEAYLLDIPTPIKGRLSNYKEIESRLMRIIAKKFGFDYPLHSEVKAADERALHREWNWWVHGDNDFGEDFIIAEKPSRAREKFLERYAKFSLVSPDPSLYDLRRYHYDYLD